MSKVTGEGKKRRLEEFVENHLWSDGVWRNSANEELDRLSSKQQALLEELDGPLCEAVVQLVSSTVEYKRALRLALTIVDTQSLPADGPPLVQRAFELAKHHYADSKKHGSRTGEANVLRAKGSISDFEPYLDEAYFRYLSDNPRAPGRSHLMYHTEKIMKENGVPKAVIQSLTEHTVKSFLKKKRELKTGLLGSLMTS